jgi:hypothetical protein
MIRSNTFTPRTVQLGGLRALAIVAAGAAIAGVVALALLAESLAAPIQRAATQAPRAASSTTLPSLERRGSTLCPPDFYLTGDLIGDANPLQIYLANCQQ